VGASAGTLRKGRWGHRSMLMQQAGHAVVDAPVAEEGTSLATSKWYQFRDCRRRATPGCCWPCYCCRSCRSRCVCLSPSPYPCLCRHCWEWRQEGEGPSEDTTVPTAVAVGAAAVAKDALLLRARSRTWKPVPGPPSCLARSPQV
jgi:hypothetical protein